MAGAFYAVGVCDSDCGSGLSAIGDCADDNLFDCEVVSRGKEIVFGTQMTRITRILFYNALALQTKKSAQIRVIRVICVPKKTIALRN